MGYTSVIVLNGISFEVRESETNFRALRGDVRIETVVVKNRDAGKILRWSDKTGHRGG